MARALRQTKRDQPGYRRTSTRDGAGNVGELLDWQLGTTIEPSAAYVRLWDSIFRAVLEGISSDSPDDAR